MSKFKSICSIVGCDKNRKARSWCGKHHERWRKYGDPLKVLHYHGDPDAAFEARTIPEPMSGCLLWVGGTHIDGYGLIWVNGKMVGAHRYSWEKLNGPIPDGMHILHRCDNPPCVNPDHLFLGTNADNMADRNAKGRQARLKGEQNGSSKLTEADVLLILSDHRTQKLIACDFDVHQSTISFIKCRKSWTHVALI